MARKLKLDRSGVVVRKHAVDGMESVAVYDETEKYRFFLQRTWDVNSNADVVAFIGLNPSTATELQNDPTVNRCQIYARDWGYGGFIMLNIFGLRSTDPKGLKQVDDPTGSLNDTYIKLGVQHAKTVVCCWGTHSKLADRHQQMRELLDGQHVTCLRQTKEGFPSHPLYLPKALTPIEYWPESK
ncbi:MAG: DUF1643 domain-containing protein [Planctomycetaceae bacterium]